MDRNKKVLLACAFAMSLAACGGGGSGGGGGGSSDIVPPAGVDKSILSGTFARGSAVLGKVYLISTGAAGKAYATDTDLNGAFRFDVTFLSPPFLLRGESADGKSVLYGIATTKTNGTTVGNITPLTDYLLAQLAPTRSAGYFWNYPQAIADLNVNASALAQQAAALKAQMAKVFETTGVDAASFDPFSGKFAPDHTGHDLVLDQVSLVRGQHPDMAMLPASVRGQIYWTMATLNGVESIDLSPDKTDPLPFGAANLIDLSPATRDIAAWLSAQGKQPGVVSGFNQGVYTVQSRQDDGQLINRAVGYGPDAKTWTLLDKRVYFPDDATLRGKGCDFQTPVGSCAATISKMDFTKVTERYWKGNIKIAADQTCAIVSYSWYPAGPGGVVGMTPATARLAGANTDHETLWGTDKDVTGIEVSDISCKTYKKEDERPVDLETPGTETTAPASSALGSLPDIDVSSLSCDFAQYAASKEKLNGMHDALRVNSLLGGRDLLAAEKFSRAIDEWHRRCPSLPDAAKQLDRSGADAVKDLALDIFKAGNGYYDTAQFSNLTRCASAGGYVGTLKAFGQEHLACWVGGGKDAIYLPAVTPTRGDRRMPANKGCEDMDSGWGAKTAIGMVAGTAVRFCQVDSYAGEIYFY